MAKTRVVVVDDSALVRSLLAAIINRLSDMECVGTAADPLIAREIIRTPNADLIMLDVEMPRMDGIDFLGKLMRLRPTPVVMVSTLTERGAEVTLRALELGAIDFVAKPKVGVADGLRLLADDITDKVRVVSMAQMRRPSPSPTGAAKVGEKAAAVAATITPIGRLSTEKLVFIGASTGGTEATKEVLVNLPADCPAVLITQHMPASFPKSYAARLDGLCRIRVAEARNGERILPGHAYIAPGGTAHLSVERSGANYIARVVDGEPAPAFGRGAVQVGRARGRAERGGHHADRHGRRWRDRDEGDARRRQLQPGAGRSELRGFRHAERSDRCGCCARGAAARANRTALDRAAAQRDWPLKSPHLSVAPSPPGRGLG